MADYAIVTPERVFESLKWNISLRCFAETKDGYKREKNITPVRISKVENEEL